MMNFFNKKDKEWVSLTPNPDTKELAELFNRIDHLMVKILTKTEEKPDNTSVAVLNQLYNRTNFIFHTLRNFHSYAEQIHLLDRYLKDNTEAIYTYKARLEELVYENKVTQDQAKSTFEAIDTLVDCCNATAALADESQVIIKLKEDK